MADQDPPDPFLQNDPALDPWGQVIEMEGVGEEGWLEEGQLFDPVAQQQAQLAIYAAQFAAEISELRGSPCFTEHKVTLYCSICGCPCYMPRFIHSPDYPFYWDYQETVSWDDVKWTRNIRVFRKEADNWHSQPNPIDHFAGDLPAGAEVKYVHESCHQIIYHIWQSYVDKRMVKGTLSSALLGLAFSFDGPKARANGPLWSTQGWGERIGILWGDESEMAEHQGWMVQGLDEDHSIFVDDLRETMRWITVDPLDVSFIYPKLTEVPLTDMTPEDFLLPLSPGAFTPDNDPYLTNNQGVTLSLDIRLNVRDNFSLNEFQQFQTFYPSLRNLHLDRRYIQSRTLQGRELWPIPANLIPFLPHNTNFHTYWSGLCHDLNERYQLVGNPNFIRVIRLCEELATFIIRLRDTILDHGGRAPGAVVNVPVAEPVVESVVSPVTVSAAEQTREPDIGHNKDKGKGKEKAREADCPDPSTQVPPQEHAEPSNRAAHEQNHPKAVHPQASDEGPRTPPHLTTADSNATRSPSFPFPPGAQTALQVIFRQVEVSQAGPFAIAGPSQTAGPSITPLPAAQSEEERLSEDSSAKRLSSSQLEEIPEEDHLRPATPGPIFFPLLPHGAEPSVPETVEEVSRATETANSPTPAPVSKVPSGGAAPRPRQSLSPSPSPETTKTPPKAPRERRSSRSLLGFLSRSQKPDQGASSGSQDPGASPKQRRPQQEQLLTPRKSSPQRDSAYVSDLALTEAGPATTGAGAGTGTGTGTAAISRVEQQQQQQIVGSQQEEAESARSEATSLASRPRSLGRRAWAKIQKRLPR
jgi:hypothetical protein